MVKIKIFLLKINNKMMKNNIQLNDLSLKEEIIVDKIYKYST